MNNRGMSLISVLAALGLVSILAMGVMSLSQNMMGVMQAADFNSQIQDEMFITRVNLSKEYNCTANFKDLPLGKKLSSDQMKLRLTKSKTDLDLSKSFIIPAQDPMNKSSKMTVSEMELKPYPGSDSLALLAISFEAKNTSITGGHTRTREIPLEVLLVGNRIVKCSAAGSNFLDDLEDPETDSTKNQGVACTSSPNIKATASASNVERRTCRDCINGHWTTGSSASHTVTLKKNDFQDALNSLCDNQTYPVKKGLAIHKSILSEACGNGAVSEAKLAKCATLRAIACLEMSDSSCYTFTTHALGITAPGATSVDGLPETTILTKRNGYTNKEECKKQKLFSEGDTIQGDSKISCINGSWNGGTHLKGTLNHF